MELKQWRLGWYQKEIERRLLEALQFRFLGASLWIDAEGHVTRVKIDDSSDVCMIDKKLYVFDKKLYVIDKKLSPCRSSSRGDQDKKLYKAIGRVNLPAPDKDMPMPIVIPWGPAVISPRAY